LLAVHIASEWSPYGCAITRFLTQEWPGSLEVADNEGWLPLHYAAAERGTLGAMTKHSKGWLKNRIKSWYGLAFLVEQNPASVRAKDIRGNLPLHYALAGRDPAAEASQLPREDWSRQNCQLLVEAWPESVQVVDADGLLP
jgi:hypothetical protein